MTQSIAIVSVAQLPSVRHVGAADEPERATLVKELASRRKPLFQRPN